MFNFIFYGTFFETLEVSHLETIKRGTLLKEAFKGYLQRKSLNDLDLKLTKRQKKTNVKAKLFVSTFSKFYSISIH